MDTKHRAIPLAIIGGGAAGLFAGCTAGESGLGALILERKHKPARKMLVCANGRCNFTKDIPVEQMLSDLGSPVATFADRALRTLPPQSIHAWFRRHGLDTKHMEDRRIFPASEHAADVVHTLTDTLRDCATPLCLNTPVTAVEKMKYGFLIATRHFTVTASNVLLATGGVSFPKTGSVGDGQTFARKLGHALVPYRAGLVGFECVAPGVRRRAGNSYLHASCTVCVNGKTVIETSGQIDCETWGLSGAAVYNASRVVARQRLTRFTVRCVLDGEAFTLDTPATRPLKEAIVTMGGVALNEIDPETMQSRICPGLYFAGEIMDVDGPTGGYNLSLAFATAALAVRSVAQSIATPR